MRYGYSNARVKAMKSKLFNRDRLREILDVKTLTEFIEMLEESPYKQSLVDASVSYSGLPLIKHALDQNLAATYRKVVGFSPKEAQPLLNFYLKTWQINNLKKIIALKAMGQTPDKDDLFLYDSNQEAFLAPFIAAKNLTDCIAELSKTEYAPEVLRAKTEFSADGDYRHILSALDTHYYGILALHANSESDSHLRHFLHVRINVLNAMIILRMMQTKIPTQTINEQLIPLDHAQLPAHMLSATTIEAAVTVAQSYLHVKFSDDALNRLKEGSLSGIELELEAMLLTEARKTLRLSVLSEGTLVAFLYLKQEEVHALRKIAYATVLDVKDEVRKTVFAAE
jgi:V/A-type H+-transporting ATPase subunit C